MPGSDTTADYWQGWRAPGPGPPSRALQMSSQRERSLGGGPAFRHSSSAATFSGFQFVFSTER
jgi:hypothetical protein